MIKVNQVSKKFGSLKAVDNISFEVEEQENMILLGTSGCGKTTTLKMINRLIETSIGSIFIHDRNINDSPPEILRRSIGYVSQNNGLFPHYTVEENIAIVPQLLKWDKKKIRDRTAELMGKLHLSEDYLHAFPNELSGGQQQRIALARALISDPSILLMDEPFGALDNVTRVKIQEEFQALDELKRKTIVMVTHDVQEAFELGNRIAIMDKGKIVQSGTPASLLFKPQNSFVEQFLKDQRLQLELKTLKMSDLWPFLPSEKRDFNGEILKKETDLWTALEQFQFTGAETLQIGEDQMELKTIRLDQLMQAFHQYKQQ